VKKIWAILTCGVLLLSACGTSGPPGDAGRIDPKLVADLAPADARTVGQAVDDFGFDLFGQVADGKQNTIVSPLSMAVLLAMLLAGADGKTADEIGRVLHLEDRRDVRVGALLRQLSDTDEATLSVADALWAGQGTPIEKDYVDYLGRNFGASARNADLGSPKTAQQIDQWASDNTKGLIKDIASDLGLPDPSVVLVLLNAVYFLGKWTTPFDPAATRPEPFHLAGGASADVPMMHQSDQTYGYTQRDGYRMLRLPYGKHGRYGLEILLPDDGKTLDGMLRSVDAAEWQAAVGRLQPEKIDELALPKFELRWKAVLNQPLIKLGMPTAFGLGQADFRPMSAVDPALTTVVQKTYVRVDEHGTEAAAVSGGAMAASARIGPATVFRVDKPFAFTISDQQTGTILFLGAVTDPRS
jgi:serine protease inhibitor